MHISLGNSNSRHFKTFVLLLVIELLQCFHQSQALLSKQPIKGERLTYSYLLASCPSRRLFLAVQLQKYLMQCNHTRVTYKIFIYLFFLLLHQYLTLVGYMHGDKILLFASFILYWISMYGFLVMQFFLCFLFFYFFYKNISSDDGNVQNWRSTIKRYNKCLQRIKKIMITEGSQKTTPLINIPKSEHRTLVIIIMFHCNIYKHIG